MQHLMVSKRLEWENLEKEISDKISSCTPAIIILLLIGAIGGTWMVAGIVPTMIYYGMQIIQPEVFLVSSSILCALVSMMIGSSWTTVATIGLALMGIGKAHGFDDGWIAGSIITGAYFGDKLSPLSDTTVLASSVAGTPLFTHIRYMLYTTVPTFCISITIFLIAGFTMDVQGHGNVHEFMEGLQHTFVISPWLLIVPVLTGVMIARRWPSMVVLFMAILLAVVVALLVQSDLVLRIAGDDGGLLTSYKGMMSVCYGSTNIETGNSVLNELVHRLVVHCLLQVSCRISCVCCYVLFVALPRLWLRRWVLHCSVISPLPTSTCLSCCPAPCLKTRIVSVAISHSC